MPAPDSFSLYEGAVFHDQYEVVRRIDSGAMGTVYEVVDRRTKRRRALKVMLARFADNPEVTERFRREATITADVVSEHVVETFDAGVDAASGLPFLVMELLRGEDLGKMVARGPLLATEVVTLLMQAASALDKMHAAGVIHRDLKPENLFVTRRDDGAPRLKVLDFGIAKVIEKTAPSATTTRNMGTPVYMSPEQVTGAGTVGPAADLYAVGQLAYTMLVGEPYWLEDALAHETVYPLLLRIMEGVIEPSSQRALRTKKITLPEGFDAWFAKATAREPEGRFTAAVESIAALAVALDVARPPLPSATLDLAMATAPTVTPPSEEEEAFPLLPAPPLVPKGTEPAVAVELASPDGPVSSPRRDEALRTLNPVSTLPGEPPRSSPREEPRSRSRAIVALGAFFFVAGVLVAVVIARPGRRATALETSGSEPVRTGVAVFVEPSTSAPAPEISAAASVPPSASAPVAAASAQTTTAPAPTPRLTGKLPSKRPPQPKTSTTARPARTYGDPARDL